MNTREWKIVDAGWLARSVLECGGKHSATPLSRAGWRSNHSQLSSARKLRRRCALPEQSKTWRSFVVMLIFLAAASLVQAQYSIHWSTIDGGGGTSTGGVYSVSGTIGQPDAGGTMTGGNYSLTGGFWSLFAVQTPGAPTLAIVRASPGQATISWTPNTPGFVLQETLNSSLTNWVNSASGITNPIVVPATGPIKLYRLFKP
jgi:hypothetical protein